MVAGVPPRIAPIAQTDELIA